MNLSENFNHTLKFYIKKDIPNDVLQKWNQFKLLFESNNNDQIVQQIINNCKFKNNKNITYLNCYQNNSDNSTIVFDQICDNENWTYKELDDLILAFTKIANINIQENAVTGSIMMIEK